jgi:Tfp pilus assembly protein PilN
MKIYIDLLPEERKEEIKKKKMFKMAISQEIRFLFPVVVFIIFLAVTGINLKIQLEGIAEMTDKSYGEQGYKKIAEFEKKFKEINAKTAAEAGFQQSHLIWSNTFSELSNIMPAGLYLEKLSTKDYLMTISGKAKTRNDLLAFQEKLKESPCFANTDVPLSNLVSRENVEFEINLEINKDCLKKK